MLTAGRTRGVRVIVALGVAAEVWGWGVAQYPVLLPGTAVTLSNAGAPNSTMTAIVVLFIVPVLLIGPSFALRFTRQNRHLRQAGEPATSAAGIAAWQTRATSTTGLTPVATMTALASSASSSWPKSAPGRPEAPCPRQSSLMTLCRAAKRSASTAKKLRPLLHHPGQPATSRRRLLAADGGSAG